MENSLLIGLLGSLIGSGFTLLGGLLNSYFTRQNLQLQLTHQKQQEESRLRLSKLDELYKGALEFQRSAFIYYSTVARIYKEPVSHELINELTVNLLTPMQQVNALVSFYAPDLYSLLEELSSALVAFQHQGLSMLAEGNEDFNKFHSLYWGVSEAAVNLLEKIQHSSTNYTGLPKIREPIQEIQTKEFEQNKKLSEAIKS